MLSPFSDVHANITLAHCDAVGRGHPLHQLSVEINSDAHRPFKSSELKIGILGSRCQDGPSVQVSMQKPLHMQLLERHRYAPKVGPDANPVATAPRLLKPMVRRPVARSGLKRQVSSRRYSSKKPRRRLLRDLFIIPSPNFRICYSFNPATFRRRRLASGARANSASFVQSSGGLPRFSIFRNTA